MKHTAVLWLTVWLASAASGHMRNGSQPGDTNYDEAKVPDYVLPRLLPDGLSTEQALELWRTSRRAEILRLFADNVYGNTPTTAVELSAKVVEQSESALNGMAVRRQVALTITPVTDADQAAAQSLTINVLIYTPKRASGASPAFVGLNFYGNQSVEDDPAIIISDRWMRNTASKGIVDNRATEDSRGANTHRWPVQLLVERGYGLVTAYYGDIDPDKPDPDLSDGAHPLFYKSGQTQPGDHEWGAIGAWAWGLSQIRTWLEDDSLIDAQRLAVIGHSRLGKTALWAGAQDERFAMVISNDSGCGGAALFVAALENEFIICSRDFLSGFAATMANSLTAKPSCPLISTCCLR